MNVWNFISAYFGQIEVIGLSLSPLCLYAMSIIVQFFLITKRVWKIVFIDILWWILFILSTGAFFRIEGRSWGLTGDGKMAIFVLFVYIMIVNAIFIFIQGLLTGSTTNRENSCKMLKLKRRCYLIHVVLLFVLSLFFEVAPLFLGNGGDLDWAFYIIIFAVSSYLLYDYLLHKVIGCQGGISIFNKLVNRIGTLGKLIGSKLSSILQHIRGR
jgi:hypothetical protein